MSPTRTEIRNGKKIEEFYWAGKPVVYVDGHLTEMTFEESCEAFREFERYCETFKILAPNESGTM